MMGNGNADYFPKDRLLGSPAVRVPPLKLEAILQQRNSAQPIRTCKSSAQAVPIPDPKVSLSSLCTLNNEGDVAFGLTFVSGFFCLGRLNSLVPVLTRGKRPCPATRSCPG